MKMTYNFDGDECLYIHVYFVKNTPHEEGRKLGPLTGKVIDVMGEDLEDIFPYIRPMEEGSREHV